MLRCRESDRHVVDRVLREAAEEYSKKANVHAPEIIVDKTVYLPPAPSHHNPHALSWYIYSHLN